MEEKKDIQQQDQDFSQDQNQQQQQEEEQKEQDIKEQAYNELIDRMTLAVKRAVANNLPVDGIDCFRSQTQTVSKDHMDICTKLIRRIVKKHVDEVIERKIRENEQLKASMGDCRIMCRCYLQVA